MSTEEEYKVIETNDGSIRGVRTQSIRKKTNFYSFKGIPYAEKPIAELRFKPPVPVRSWRPAVLDALTFGNVCIQLPDVITNNYTQSEDCLYLNIYVPTDVESSEKLPVMFFIHGGVFALGPDFIVENRVILVTINYRLGLIGFMSLGSPEYSGNMGLKDQQLAMKWIHANIEHFGGDNNAITIFGQRAGGASVHLHMLSVDSRNFFQKAILMSGTLDAAWAMPIDKYIRNLAKQIASDFGKPTENYEELVDVLRSVSAEDLRKYCTQLDVLHRRFDINFGVVIEDPNASQPFITQPIDLVMESTEFDFDVLFTFTSRESLSYLSESFGYISDIESLNNSFTFKPPSRKFLLPDDSIASKRMHQDTREFYFGKGTITADDKLSYADFLSDLNFAYGVDKSVKSHAKKNKGRTFYSRFSVDSKLNGFKYMRKDSLLAGAAHADDLCYFFRSDFFGSIYREVFESAYNQNSKISMRAIDDTSAMFTASAKLKRNEQFLGYRIPGGFCPIRDNEVNFLDVTNDGLQHGTKPNGIAFEFWSSTEEMLQSFV